MSILDDHIPLPLLNHIYVSNEVEYPWRVVRVVGCASSTSDTLVSVEGLHGESRTMVLLEWAGKRYHEQSVVSNGDVLCCPWVSGLYAITLGELGEHVDVVLTDGISWACMARMRWLVIAPWARSRTEDRLPSIAKLFHVKSVRPHPTPAETRMVVDGLCLEPPWMAASMARVVGDGDPNIRWNDAPPVELRVRFGASPWFTILVEARAVVVWPRAST